MRTASLVLGIIGGALAVIFALVFILGGAFFNVAGDTLSNAANGDFQINVDGNSITLQGSDEAARAVQAGAGFAGAFFWVIGILSIVGAVLAFVGSALVKNKNIVAGVLLIVAAIPSFFTGLGIIASILLILAGVFALVPAKQEQAPAA